MIIRWFIWVCLLYRILCHVISIVISRIKCKLYYVQRVVSYFLSLFMEHVM